MCRRPGKTPTPGRSVLTSVVQTVEQTPRPWMEGARYWSGQSSAGGRAGRFTARPPPPCRVSPQLPASVSLLISDLPLVVTSHSLILSWNKRHILLRTSILQGVARVSLLLTFHSKVTNILWFEKKKTFFPYGKYKAIQFSGTCSAMSLFPLSRIY